jgi:hypothetical protein
VRLALVVGVVAAFLGGAAAGAYSAKLVTIHDLVVVRCDPQAATFCEAATPRGRMIVIYTGRERFRSMPRVGSRVDVRGFDIRDGSDAYLGVLALELPTTAAATRVTRTGTASRLRIHGKVGVVRAGRVGFVSIRWVRSPIGGPVIGNLYERISFPASATALAQARRMQWDRISRPFDRETWAFSLRLVRGSYRLVDVRRDE